VVKWLRKTFLMTSKPNSFSSVKSFVHGNISMFPFTIFCFQIEIFLTNAVTLSCRSNMLAFSPWRDVFNCLSFSKISVM
jgi:hypothetical protein